MSFGKINVRISIAEETVTKDAEGFATKTSNILASVHTYREGRHGSQKWVNRAVFSEATDLFRFRVIPGLNVTTAHVILCGDDRFEITSVEDVKGRGMYLEVLAKKVTSHG
jgi:head-tail adaptor